MNRDPNDFTVVWWTQQACKPHQKHTCSRLSVEDALSRLRAALELPGCKQAYCRRRGRLVSQQKLMRMIETQKRKQACQDVDTK